MFDEEGEACGTKARPTGTALLPQYDPLGCRWYSKGEKELSCKLKTNRKRQGIAVSLISRQPNRRDREALGQIPQLVRVPGSLLAFLLLPGTRLKK